LTCYDLRFPVWSRYGWAGKYDAIICVANWPQKRMDAWRVLTHARAIENQCYMIAVNRVGEGTACSYEGGSMVIDPIGRTMVACKENAEQSLVATVSIEEINKARNRFRVLSDGDYPMV
jgi:predicted amidohydrolase